MMKSLNPELYLVGEIWSDPTRWLSDGVFDGVMNYLVYYAIRDFFLLRSIGATQFCDRMTRYLALTPEFWKEGMFQFCSARYPAYPLVREGKPHIGAELLSDGGDALRWHLDLLWRRVAVHGWI